MSQVSNSEIVQSMYAAVGRGDIAAVMNVLDENVDWVMPGPAVIPFAGTRRGKQGAGEFFAALGASIEFQMFEPREFVAQGETVVALGAERSLAKPTGRVYEQEWAHVYRLRGGKITECRIIENTAVMAAAFSGN